MKMFHNMYRMATLCLMAVIALAAHAQTTQVILATQPAGVGYIECYNNGGYYRGDTITATEGDVFYMNTYEIYGWIYEGVYDETGTLITSEYNTSVTMPEPGLHTWTARYTYHPANPGHLPLGTYNAASGVLSMESTCSTGESSEKYGNMLQQDYLALAARYNLPNYDNNGEGTAEVLSFKLIGCTDRQLDGAGYIVRMLPTLQTFDCSELTGLTVIENWSLYGSGFETLILPETIEAVYSSSFELPNLNEIILPATTPPAFGLDADTFEININDETTVISYNNITLYVPAESLNDYLQHEGWSHFNIREISGRTASVTVEGVNSPLMAGGVLTLMGADGASMSKTIVADSVRYVFPNLITARSYSIRLKTADGRYDAADPIEGLVFTADTTVTMTMRAMGRTFVHVTAGEMEVTDNCTTAWIDPATGEVVAAGATSPIMPIGDSITVRVLPTGEIGVYYASAEAGYRMEEASNGIWLTLERKDIAQGNDTIATGSLSVIAYGDASRAVGLVYDNAGNLVGKYGFAENTRWNHFEFLAEGMLPGNYTLVAMQDGPYATAFRLDQLDQMGLTAGADYVEEVFEIVGGQNTEVLLRGIPEIAEVTTHTSAAAFFANKSEVIASNRVLLTAEVEFVAEDVAEISDLVYYVDLPDNLTIETGSVLVGNNSVAYSVYEGRLTVPAGAVNVGNKEATRLRFYAVPTTEGEFYPSATIEYRYRSNTMTEPVGNAYFAAKAVTISAPAVTLVPTFEATGYAPSLAVVKIVTAEGDTIGTATASRTGFYRAECTIDPTGTTEYTIHAAASTPYVARLVSGTVQVRYDADAARPTDCFMTHMNGWYHRPMDVTWDFGQCSTSVKYYYYFHGEDFTFRTNMTGVVDSLYFVVAGIDGSKTTVSATAETGGTVWSAVQYFTTARIPVRVDVAYYVAGEYYYFSSCKSVQAIADPSGYVYEAVPSNRVEGVTATAWYKESEEAAELQWDATEYDQINPQTTDYAGAYGWDVPNGLWQVRFSKSGFEPAQTEWLPVPPPQLEINVPMVRLSAPTVKQIDAYSDGVVIEFDRYMKSSDMIGPMVRLSADGTMLQTVILLLDAESDPKGNSYVRRIRVRPEDNAPMSGELIVHIDTVHSYAGVPFAVTERTVNVVPKVTGFGQIDTLVLTVGEPLQRTVYALPGNAAAGKTMAFDALGSSLYSLDATGAVIGADGAATLTLTGLVPGKGELRIAVEGTTIETYVPVVVKAPSAGPVTPTGICTPTAAETEKAEKYLRDGILYLKAGGRIYTATGETVK